MVSAGQATESKENEMEEFYTVDLVEDLAIEHDPYVKISEHVKNAYVESVAFRFTNGAAQDFLDDVREEGQEGVMARFAERSNEKVFVAIWAR